MNAPLKKDPATFSEFWPFYLSQHLHPASRLLHFFGTWLALICVVAEFRFGPKMLLFALVAGYGPAWIGHYFLEKNRPATFRYPWWSLMADFRMFVVMLRGGMQAELAQYGLRSLDEKEDA